MTLPAAQLRDCTFAQLDNCTFAHFAQLLKRTLFYVQLHTFKGLPQEAPMTLPAAQLRNCTTTAQLYIFTISKDDNAAE